MGKGNVDTWGNIPGDFGLEVTRNVTMINYTNPEEMFDSSKTPIFQLVDPVILKEYNIISDINLYGDDKINFTCEYKLEVIKNISTNEAALNQKVTIPNIYALGAWVTTKSYNLTTKAFSALGGLIWTIFVDDVTYMSSLAVGVDTLYFQGKTFDDINKQVFEQARLTINQATQLWNDPIMGWKDVNTRKYWVQAVVRGFESDDSVILKQYFNLEYAQMEALMSGQLKESIIASTTVLKNGYACPGDACTSEFLGYVQLASQNITLHPPSGPSMESIVDTNTSAFGYPEISYYFSKVFVPKISSDPLYKKSCNFTYEQMQIWFNHTDEGCASTWNTLIHPTNMDVIIRAGLKFRDTQDLGSFNDILERFRLSDVYQARILFEYLNYLAIEFSTVESMDYELTVRSALFYQGMVPLWQGLLLSLKPALVQTTALSLIKTNKIDCPSAVKLSSPLVDNDSIVKFCGNGFAENNVETLYSYCTNRTHINFDATFRQFGFTFLQASQLCDLGTDQPGSTANLLQSAESKISTHYNCGDGTYCNGHELIAIQWVNQSISQNPLPEISSVFPKADSVAEWFPKVIPAPFEYAILSPNMKKPWLEDTLKMLFWERYFASPPIVKAIAEARQGKPKYLQDTFGQDNVKDFEIYLNNFVLNVVFNGTTITDSVGTLMFNYSSPFLESVYTTNPILGGDPTATPMVPLTPISTNITQTRFTGASNLSQVDQFTALNGKSYINAPMLVFDGNQTSMQYVNPWEEEVQVEGSDNVYPSSLTNQTKVTAYITDMFRFGTTTYVKDIDQIRGLKTLRFRISDDTLADNYTVPSNSRYYQFGYNGAINMTSVQRTPIFLTRMFMFGFNKSVANRISLIDQKGNPLTYNEDTDDLFLDIEPNTGVPMKINFDLQTNVEIAQDSLFEIPTTFMMPIFLLRRNMAGLNNHQIDEIFGDLLLANNIAFYGRWTAAGLAIVGLLVLVLVMVNNNGIGQKDNDRETTDSKDEPLFNDSGKTAENDIDLDNGKNTFMMESAVN